MPIPQVAILSGSDHRSLPLALRARATAADDYRPVVKNRCDLLRAWSIHSTDGAAKQVRLVPAREKAMLCPTEPLLY